MWWDEDPGDTGEIHRVTTQKQNRVNRLKALGNGQVPRCVVVAWTLLFPISGNRLCNLDEED